MTTSNGSSWLRHDTRIQLLFAFLVISAASVRAIPFLYPWGIDLHYSFVYQKCMAGRSPYSLSPIECGEIWKRAMLYPPVLFRSYFWMRWMSFDAAIRIWSSFTIVLFAGVLYAWVRHLARERRDARSWEIWVFCGLLLFQYPFVFLLERGGSDIPVVALLTATAYLLGRRKPLLAGLAAGLASGYKLYPLIATGVLGAAMLIVWIRNRGVGRGLDWLRFGLGALVAAVGLNLIVYPDAKVFFGEKLSGLMATLTPVCVWNHSIASFAGPNHRLFAALVGAALCAIWIWAAARALARGDAPFAVAGALAVSTYTQGTSWDYNLTTTYPLLVLLMLEARRRGRWGLLVFGLFAIVGERQIFAAKGALIFDAAMHLAVQLAFLVIAAVHVARGPDEAPATAAQSI